MSYWKALRLLSGHLWRWDLKGVIVTFLFSLYMGATIGLNATNAMFSGEGAPGAFKGLVINWIFLLIIPIMGSCMNRTIFSIWRDDSYTRRMAVLRAYPIPLPVIIGSRVAQSVAMTAINVTVMLAMIYAQSPDLRDSATVGQWIAFDGIWICYGLIINAAAIGLELGYSGKRYVMIHTIKDLIVSAIVVALAFIDINPFMEVLTWTELDGALAIVLCAIGLAVTALWLGYRATIRKIRTRSITF